MTWQPDTSAVALGDRRLFEPLEAFAYLNHAAISPPSSEVRRAVLAVVDDYARRGVSSFGAWREQRERLRARLARLIGADADEIALASSTTRTVVDVALCLPWREGERVICLRGEFPTNVTPWQRAAETFGLELAFLDVEDFRTDRGLEALDAELERGARLIAVSAVQFQSGLRMPIGEIARRAHDAGAEVFVDAIQACGVVPLDVHRLGVDYLGCGSHKWLMGTEGAGFLYVRRDRAASLVPRVAGWLSHEEPLSFLFEGAGHLRYDKPIRRDPTFLESGATNAIGFAALEASVAAIQHLGVHAIWEHVQRYHDALEPELRARGFASRRHPEPDHRSGILSFIPPDHVELPALWRALGEERVACTMPDGHLRFAPHWPNSLDEVPKVAAALDRCS